MHSRAIDTVEQFVVFSSLLTAFGNFGAAVLPACQWLKLTFGHVSIYLGGSIGLTRHSFLGFSAY